MPVGHIISQFRGQAKNTIYRVLLKLRNNNFIVKSVFGKIELMKKELFLH